MTDRETDLAAYLSYNGIGSLDARLRNSRRPPRQAASDRQHAPEPSPKSGPSYPPLTDEERGVWERQVSPVVERIARAVYGKNKGASFDDLLQEGYEISIAAMREYNRKIGTLEGYIGFKVKNRLSDSAGREYRRRKRSRPLLPEHERTTLDGPCRLEREEDKAVESAAIAKAVQRLRHFLSPREIDFLRLRVSMKHKEIAQQWRCTERWVKQVKADALKALDRESNLNGVPKSKILAVLLVDSQASGRQLLCQEERILENSTSPCFCLSDT